MPPRCVRLYTVYLFIIFILHFLSSDSRWLVHISRHTKLYLTLYPGKNNIVGFRKTNYSMDISGFSLRSIPTTHTLNKTQLENAPSFHQALCLVSIFAENKLHVVATSCLLFFFCKRIRYSYSKGTNCYCSFR